MGTAIDLPCTLPHGFLAHNGIVKESNSSRFNSEQSKSKHHVKTGAILCFYSWQ